MIRVIEQKIDSTTDASTKSSLNMLESAVNEFIKNPNVRVNFIRYQVFEWDSARWYSVLVDYNTTRS